jgi:hypothetical protein
MRYIYYYCFILKGMSLDCLEISLVYELPNCRCIASRTTYCQYEDSWFSSMVSKREMLNLYGLYVDQMNLGWKGAFAPLLAEKVYSQLFKHVISLYIWIDALYLSVRNNMTEQNHLERKREYHPRGRWSSSSMTGWERVVPTWESKRSRHLGCETER